MLNWEIMGYWRQQGIHPLNFVFRQNQTVTFGHTYLLFIDKMIRRLAKKLFLQIIKIKVKDI